MPSRRPRRRGGEHVPLDVDRLLQGVARVEHRAGAEWHVQPIGARSAVKDYACPGCGGTIPPQMPHLVVWRADSIFGDRAIEDRRHWHPGCWRAS
ncbi:hypothetical protein OVA14_09870 [Agrococcus sp. SL85]|uniref:hypothetical protein n=1 Tax=Agrococcus sp. SL85 TaxID=2995141 RepID=UPI00226CC081|nr:hypothetical protein [Agrococcus sp. SL85]WAC65641.1 hypothetical protein OVA14_09870 [Agrococcus sp. SL85]